MIPEWHRKALCSEVAPDLFFPEKNASAVETRFAKSLCAKCPVRVQCLEYALDANEVFGIWGGTTPQERFLLRRLSKKG